jgi:serine/threonine-protein kinase
LTLGGQIQTFLETVRMVGRIFLSRYEALRLLGEGGMGRVYLARQIDLGRQVVVKVMHDHVASDPKFRDRFQRETLMMARFQHPYVVTLFDASLNDPQGPCIVMEYIKGITLDTLLQRNNRLTPTRIVRLLGQLCEALQAAHTQGIVHRDLKPTNLMVVDPDTPYEKIKVMDFGLAKLIDNERVPVHQVTQTGADFAVGTPGYISPEQVRGDEMDHRSDLYSVGIILFELLTGKLPFKGDTTMDVLLAHATEDPPSFADVGAKGLVPAAIEEVVLSCLAKQPDQRPQSARDLAERFETAIEHEQLLLERSAVQTQPTQGADGEASQDNPGRPSHDPRMVVQELEAWMPEKIAAYKLRGFVQDVGGEVIESVPGVIRVRLGGRKSVYAVPAQQGPLGWLGLGRNLGLVDMELRLERSASNRNGLLHITVLMSSPDGKAHVRPEWRSRCGQIFCDLRAYLMGDTNSKAELQV